MRDAELLTTQHLTGCKGVFLPWIKTQHVNCQWQGICIMHLLTDIVRERSRISPVWRKKKAPQLVITTY